MLKKFKIKIEGKKPLGRPERKWGYNMKMDFKKYCVRLWAEIFLAQRPVAGRYFVS
jgi:hypothetical protein